jgi:hypothetical protein
VLKEHKVLVLKELEQAVLMEHKEHKVLKVLKVLKEHKEHKVL